MVWSAPLPKRPRKGHDVSSKPNIKTEVRRTMKHNNAKGDIVVLGVDLAKMSFQLHGVDGAGRVVLKKKVTRKKLSALITNLPSCLIGLEACGGAHYWVRKFTGMGDIRCG